MNQPIPDAEPRVLGQLLTAHSAFSVFSDKQKMAEFIQQAVEGVPGVSSCGVCLRGGGRPRMGAADIHECDVCEIYRAEIGRGKGDQCPLSNQTGMRVIPLQTQDEHYGFLVLKLEADKPFAAYAPFVDNLANSLALNAEWRWQGQRLDAANSELLTLRDHLRELVAERTDELKGANDRLQHLNAVLRSIRGVNHIIVREGNVDRLVQTVCECLIETRSYPNAWIALAEPAGELIPRGMASTDEAYIGSVKQLGPANELRCIASALKHPGVVTVADPCATCSGCSLSQNESPGRSAMAVRLEHRGRVFGVLVVSADSKFATDEEEHALLVEVAEDVGLALRGIEQTSERKRAEEALRLKDLVLDASIAANSITDVNGAIAEANDAFLRLWGYPVKDEVIGKPLAHFLDDPNEVAAILTALNETGQWEGDYSARRRDGSVFVAHCLATTLRDMQGSIVGYQSAVLDITARKREEMKLRRMATVVRDSNDAITIQDFEGRITAWNHGAELMYGYSEEEAFQLHIDRLTTPNKVAEQKDFVRRLVAGEAVTSFQTQRVTKDGRVLDVWMTVTKLMDDAGKSIGLASTERDITEHKKLEEQLRASQKMEAIGSLAGGVAHDFNNLLSVILSYTEFAIEGVREGDPMRDDLLEVKKAGEHAAALTRQLLAFSRKQILQPVPLDLNQIAAGVEKMLRRILGEDIDLLQKLTPDIGLTLADPGQIEQVLMNLVVNARDAMPEGGKLTIETSNVEIDEEYAARHVAVKPGPYVQLMITDTGCGMDQQTKARLFEPFFTTKEKGKGTGLGLATVYGIVTQSGGKIWVYSELGQGTTFKIYLPCELSATEATAIKPPTVPTRTTGTETILVTEDEEALCKVAKRALDAAGYTVLTARDGKEALSICAQHAGDIQLLLTDVVMPGMSGRTLVQELLKTRPTLKILYMSGYTDNAIVHHGVLDTGTHFLAKPFTAADLTRRVREVLNEGITNLTDGHEHAVVSEAAVKERPLDNEALRALSPDVLDKLRRAVIAVRYNEIIELVEIIRITEPSVAGELRRMADLFDYDGMRHLLGR